MIYLPLSPCGAAIRRAYSNNIMREGDMSIHISCIFRYPAFRAISRIRSRRARSPMRAQSGMTARPPPRTAQPQYAYHPQKIKTHIVFRADLSRNRGALRPSKPSESMHTRVEWQKKPVKSRVYLSCFRKISALFATAETALRAESRETELSQSLVNHDRDGVGKIERTQPRAHRYTDRVLVIGGEQILG